MAKKYLDDTGMTYFWGKLKSYFQPKLVSGTNIKTINNESVLGSGNITISGGGSGTSPEFDNGVVEHRDFSVGTVAGASSAYKDITFNKTFSQIPSVVVQEDNRDIVSYGNVNILVANVTTTGFRMYIHTIPNTTLAGLWYDWIAINTNV